MYAGVADTHTALWYRYSDPRLSAAAKFVMDEAARNGEQIAVSSISLVEILYLVEKRRIPADAYELLMESLLDPVHTFREVPVTSEVVSSMRTIAREDVPDMPDRIVAATGVYLGVPILSRDGKIRAAGLETIW